MGFEPLCHSANVTCYQVTLHGPCGLNSYKASTETNHARLTGNCIVFKPKIDSMRKICCMFPFLPLFSRLSLPRPFSFHVQVDAPRTCPNIFVRQRGLEPPPLSGPVPQTGASTIPPLPHNTALSRLSPCLFICRILG